MSRKAWILLGLPPMSGGVAAAFVGKTRKACTILRVLHSPTSRAIGNIRAATGTIAGLAYRAFGFAVFPAAGRAVFAEVVEELFEVLLVVCGAAEARYFSPDR
jgi:hypothetical protein